MSSAQIKVTRRRNDPLALTLANMGVLSGLRNPVRGSVGQQASVPNQPGGSDAAQGQAQSNSRFNSFCERFVIERCRDWPQEGLPEAAWRTIQDAKTVYHMIQGVSAGVTDR